MNLRNLILDERSDAEQIGEQRGIQIGEQRGEQRGEQTATLNCIRSLMTTAGYDVILAMNALNIPADEQPKYAELLKHQ